MNNRVVYGMKRSDARKRTTPDLAQGGLLTGEALLRHLEDELRRLRLAKARERHQRRAERRAS